MTDEVEVQVFEGALEQALAPGERVVWTERPDDLLDLVARSFPIVDANPLGPASPTIWLLMAFYYGMLLGMVGWPLEEVLGGRLTVGPLTCVFAIAAPFYALVAAIHVAEVFRRRGGRYHVTDRGRALLVHGTTIRVGRVEALRARDRALEVGPGLVLDSLRRPFERARELAQALGRDPGPVDPLEAALEPGEVVTWTGRPSLFAGEHPGCLVALVLLASLGAWVASWAFAVGGSPIEARFYHLCGLLILWMVAIPFALWGGRLLARLRTRAACTDRGAVLVRRGDVVLRVPTPPGLASESAADAALAAIERAPGTGIG